MAFTVVRGGRGGRKGRAQEDLQSSGTIPYYIIMVISAILHLQNLTERTTPGVNPNVNYRLWVRMTCHYRFIDGNKCTTGGKC